jgi:hypothetical protein
VLVELSPLRTSLEDRYLALVNGSAPTTGTATTSATSTTATTSTIDRHAMKGAPR